MGLLAPHGRHRCCAGEAHLSLRLRAQNHRPPGVRSGAPLTMSKPFRTLDDVNVSGKRVLLRVDLNVPTENGRVTDTTRIERVASTITEIADKGGKVIMLAHFGRPKGARDEAYSLHPVAAAVADVIKRPVAFATDCIGETAAATIAKMKNGDILLLENTRFYKGEEKNDPAF